MTTSFSIEFRGRMRRVNEDLASLLRSQRKPDNSRQTTHPGDEEIVRILNGRADLIAQRIRSEIRKTVSTFVNIDVEIEFVVGSVEWIGIVYVLDWMSRLSGTASLVEYLTRTVRFAVNRVVREEIQTMVGGANQIFETETTLVDPLQGSTNTQIQLSNFTSSFRTLSTLMMVNTIVLLIILGLNIYVNFIR
ncbi:MAG TPA: hypothetical protein VGD58_08015 [Herpetosiphonaceae bacterium]